MKIEAASGLALTIGGILVAAGVAWGAASARLTSHDEELAKLRAQVTQIAIDVATLVERTK